MTDRKRLQIYVTEENYKQLKEWSQDCGKSISELGREAILEYTDQDRIRRIEDKLDRVLETIPEENNTHTQRSNSVVGNARQVARTIGQNYDEVMKAEDVELTIENIADVGDDRSIDNYKQQLRKRGLLFEHPGDPPLWTTESEQFEQWLASYHQLNGRDAADEIAEKYPVSLIGKPGGKIDMEWKKP